MANKFVDVSAYQGSTVADFKRFKSQGAKYAFIKLTEGTNYVNPKAAAQINSAMHVFGGFGIYHFWHGEDAKYLIAIAHRYGIDLKTTPIALDVEATDLPNCNLTGLINHFESQLRAVGVPKENIWTYGSASWFNEGKIVTSQLKYGFTWVAAYGSYKPSCNAWQYTDGGGSQDWSYDYTNLLGGHSHASSDTVKIGDSEFYDSGSLFIVKSKNGINSYKDGDLSKPSGHVRPAGYKLYAKPVKIGRYYRLKTKYDNYYTANAKYLTKVK